MLEPKFLKTDKQKYLAIALGYFSACVLLYLLGALYIQFVLLLATFALFPAILIHERSLAFGLAGNTNLSDDENWSKTKKQLDKVRDSIDKTKSTEQKKVLQRQLLSLENELRRIEWKVKESDMTQMYNAAKGRLREIPEINATTSEKQTEEDGKKYSHSLDKLVKEVQKIVEKEPQESKQQALVPIANSIRAHYNMMKKNPELDSIRADYFAVWGTLSSFIQGIRINPELLKYTSRRFRKNFGTLQESLSASQVCVMIEESGMDEAGHGEGLNPI